LLRARNLEYILSWTTPRPLITFPTILYYHTYYNYSMPIMQYLLNWDEHGELLAATTQPDSPFGSGYYPIHIAVKNDHLE